MGLAVVLALGPNTPLFADQDLRNGKIKRVLLISFDGMHALDMANYIKLNPSSALGQLAAGGVNFTNASTTKPSDSFPAMIGIVTGGTPAVTGIWYDDAWHRKLSPPGSACATLGTAIDLKEGIDIDPAALDGGGGIAPSKLPLDPAKGCTPVYPHDLLRVNTIFEVIRASGGYTAYSEKRPSYDILNGPSGTGVMDLFTPEIAAYNGITDFNQVKVFDALRVDSIINEINGKDHTGLRAAPVPTIFGMNFQAINVGKKTTTYTDAGGVVLQGGYKDHFGTPVGNLALALTFIDTQMGRIITELNARGLYDSTAIIITAKHGETPLDPPRQIVLSTVIPNLINTVQPNIVLKATEKSNAFVWLRDQSLMPAVVNKLEANRTVAGIGQIIAGEELKLFFPDPLVDPAVPDVIIVSNTGVNYEKALNSTTFAEHGGFGENDTHVPMIISNPNLIPGKYVAPVFTTQIAPSILSMLRLDYTDLLAVKMEGTNLLPGIKFNSSSY
jgi:hypothetical protein